MSGSKNVTVLFRAAGVMMFWVICLGNPEEAYAADWILNTPSPRTGRVEETGAAATVRAGGGGRRYVERITRW